MLIALGDYVLHGADPFADARTLGADGVELRFGPQDAVGHPLLEAGTAAAWRSRARAAGLALPSIYAGYIAGHSPDNPEPEAQRRVGDTLSHLLTAAEAAGTRVLVLPLFAAAEPRDEATLTRLAVALAPLAERAAAGGILLALETTLPITAVLALLRRVNHPAVRIAYDVGAAAALGHDPASELKLLGGTVCQLRVRDCSADGRRVRLGEGTVGAHWHTIQAAWAPEERDIERWYVLEVPAAGDPAAWARAEIAFLRRDGARE